MKLHRLLCLLILLTMQAQATVSITVNSNGGSPYCDTFGNLLTTGNTVRVGFFDTTAPGSLLTLQVSAEDYVYKPRAEIPGFGPNDQKKTQNDIHLSFGVGIPLLGLGQMGK